MRKQSQKRLLSVVLLIAMLASLLVVPAGAAPADKAGTVGLEFEEIQVSGDELDGLYQDTADCGSTAGQDSDLAEEFDAEDIVRVSVVLDSPSALAAGYSVDDLTEDDSDADRYREALRMMQEYLAEYLVEQEPQHDRSGGAERCFRG